MLSIVGPDHPLVKADDDASDWSPVTVRALVELYLSFRSPATGFSYQALRAASMSSDDNLPSKDMVPGLALPVPVAKSFSAREASRLQCV